MHLQELVDESLVAKLVGHTHKVIVSSEQLSLVCGLIVTKLSWQAL